MAKIRVLRAITWLPVGGIERKIVEVLPRLDRTRFEVSLVCLRERGPLADELEASGIRVDCIPFRRRWDWTALRRLSALIRERNIDVVHSHMYRSNVPATVAARMARRDGHAPRVWAQIHNVGTWETSRQLAMDRFLCRWRAGVIAVSEEVRREAIEKLRLPGERVRLIYNGVDLSRFGRGEGRDDLRREFGVGPGDLVFLLAARMVEQKRPHDFLSLARRMLEDERANPAGPPLHFWLAGDGAMREELEKSARDMPIPARVHYLGQRNDMPRVMAGADAFIMTSTKEGFSNALLEAMASGLAIIATSVGGNAEAVRSGADGAIIPPLDSESLYAGALRLWTDSPHRIAIQNSARLRAREFSLESMVKKVEALYEEEPNSY